jgi:protease-4
LAWLALAVLALLLMGSWGLFTKGGAGGGKHTALVELRGVIGGEGDGSADTLTDSLRAAFEDPGTAGVLIRINSPGGSPVQAGIVYHEIRRLRAKHPNIPVHAVVEEICASGGYYVAAAADRIYVDRASLVGSIGVLMDGFGFVDAMKKLGVERRLMTAGENKAFLDGFSPLSERHRDHAQSLLDEIHRQFIDAVKRGRGDRLADRPDLFSGLIWTGARSVELGLADALGTVHEVARDVIGAERIVDFSQREALADKIARRIGTEGARALAETLSTRLVTPALR